MVLQLGYSRQLAFSQSVFMGVGAYGTGVLETKYNFSSVESLLAVIALSAVAALLVGAVVTRAPGLALALATLILPLFIYQLATFSSWLGSFSGIDGVAPFWTGSDYTATLVQTGIISVVLLGLAAGIVLRVMRSGIGLQLMAMADDERLGESIGVSLRQRRLEVFVLGSVLAAVGGAVLASAQGIVTPDVLSETSEITLLLMVFVAGRKSVAARSSGPSSSSTSPRARRSSARTSASSRESPCWSSCWWNPTGWRGRSAAPRPQDRPVGLVAAVMERGATRSSWAPSARRWERCGKRA